MAKLALKIEIKGLAEVREAFEQAAAAIQKAMDAVADLEIETASTDGDDSPQGGV